jgi:tryptophan halogenase
MMKKIENVLIVGHDASCWITALGLQTAFGALGVKVSVLELPSLLNEGDVLAALPNIQALHQLLGLHEHALFRNCQALPILGQCFAQWSGDQQTFIHGYEQPLPAKDNIDFLQYWLKARGQGLNIALDDFSMASAAAKNGRMIPEKAKSGNSLAEISVGYHLDAKSYIKLIREGALKAGVCAVKGQLEYVEVNNNRINAVVLKEGNKLEADLFIDTSGSEAILLRNLHGSELTSWTEYFAVDRILTANHQVLQPYPPFSHIRARKIGWLGLYPLQNRTAVKAAFSLKGQCEQQAISTLVEQSNVKLQDVTTKPFSSGVRKQSWLANCIAIGPSALNLEAIDSTELQVIQIGLTKLIDLWPVDASSMPEASTFNRLVNSYYANIRYFQLAHYKLNKRNGEPFWDNARSVNISNSLDAKINLFKARGKIPLFDQETFQEQNWSRIFIGHGLLPKTYNPLVENTSDKELINNIQRLLTMMDKEVNAMPTVAEYLVEKLRSFS